jgi:glycosyltransferase involved in cell wall biosynthesis
MAASQPLISVIITSYNYRHYITTAIDSALGQTYPNVEVVISDNASTDGSVPMLRERYAGDDRVRIFENEHNLGEIENANRGFLHSRGTFVNWLSADDWMLPRHLERLHETFVREPRLDVVHSGCYYADAAGRAWTLRQLPGQLPFDYVDARDELIEMLTTTCPLCWPAALFRRTVFDDVGLEKPDEGIHATDWEMQVRIALAGKRFGYLRDPSTVIRLHDAQQTGGAYVAAGRDVIDFVAILEKYLDDPAFVERTRGRELGIAKFLDDYADTSAKRGTLPATALERIAAIRARLRARAAAYEPARVREQRVSVIVPTPQAMPLADRALASIGRQTHPNWEIVVIDHGPVPFGEWLRGHPLWERISYARVEQSLLPGAARNLGMRLARGAYLTFLDEDNAVAPDHLASLVATIERTGAPAAAAGARCIVESADERMAQFEQLAVLDVFARDDDELRELLVAPKLPLDAVLFYRDTLDRCGPFDETTWLLEDYAYLLALSARAPLPSTAQVTVDVHVRVQMNHALGAHLGRYVAYLDAVYARYPVTGALAAARAAHRSAVERTIAAVVGKQVTIEQFGRLLEVLAGQS